jgi:ATP-binding cassette subfamily F protein 3
VLGLNGSGKSSLLRILAGVDREFTGETVLSPGYTVGLLEQEPQLDETKTVREIVEQGVQEMVDLLREFEEISNRFAEPMDDDEMNRLLERQGEVQEKLDALNAWDLDARLEMAMDALRCPPGDTPIKVLSGGERRRVALCRLLLKQPDILLLDEPTNHLDVQAVEWLEDFLSAYKSAYVIISHDRFFLDRTVGRVLELEFGRVDDYRGNYSQYLTLREERREAQARAYEQQQELIARAEDFIRRNIAGQKTKQAKSRRNLLARMERLENVQDPDTANFKLRPVVRTGDQALVLDHLAVGFPTRTLARNITLTLRRGERLGIIGGNGTGKTTLLKTLLGKQPPLAGELRWGTNVNPGYYDQQLRMIDDSNTVIEELRSIAPSSVTDGELRGFLGRFLFSGDDVFKSVAALSGGEKGRLALSKLIWSGFNVLLLDEPTNHLDIASCEALEDALNDYDGTIITVSHDRYFLDRIATQILFFGDDGAEYFDGGYSEFYEAHHRAARSLAEAARAEEDARRAAEVKAKQAARKSNPGKAKQKQPSAAEIENEISSVETELKELSALMSTDEIGRDHVRLFELNEKYQALDEQLQELYRRWEEAVNTV